MNVLYIAVDELPNNCIDCIFHLCRLPERIKSDGILKKYTTKRHELCPLKVINKGDGAND